MKITVSTLVAAPVAEVWRAFGGRFSSRMEAKDGSLDFARHVEARSGSR